MYVSGEESQKQIKMRAERINPGSTNCYILTETKTQNIFKQIEDLEPDIVVIDSIQTFIVIILNRLQEVFRKLRNAQQSLLNLQKKQLLRLF